MWIGLVVYVAAENVFCTELNCLTWFQWVKIFCGNANTHVHANGKYCLQIFPHTKLCATLKRFSLPTIYVHWNFHFQTPPFTYNNINEMDLVLCTEWPFTANCLSDLTASGSLLWTGSTAFTLTCMAYGAFTLTMRPYNWNVLFVFAMNALCVSDFYFFFFLV